MYYQVISQCTRSLKNLESCLDKAKQHAAAKKFDVGVLMTSRLAPDSAARKRDGDSNKSHYALVLIDDTLCTPT